jgi:hypothetical protein
MPPGAQFQIALGSDAMVEDIQVADGWLTLWVDGDASVFHHGTLVLDYGVQRLEEAPDAAEEARRETDLAASRPVGRPKQDRPLALSEHSKVRATTASYTSSMSTTTIRTRK